MDTVRFTCHIEKSEPALRRFWGRGYVVSKDGTAIVDHSGDVIDTPEAMTALESAFYDFVREIRSGDLEHTDFDAATMIEGVIVTPEKRAAGLFPDEMPDGILVGFQANDSDAGDALWEGVSSGRLTALSIVGEGEKVKL